MSNEVDRSFAQENCPEMEYEIAGKEAYAQEAPVQFQTNGLKFVAYPDGHYEQVVDSSSPTVESKAPVSVPRSIHDRQEKGGKVDCARCQETKDSPTSFVCPKEIPFKQKKDALMVKFPHATASATAARIKSGGSEHTRYTALVHTEPGGAVCLGVAVADTLCETLNSAWLVACDVVNGEGEASTERADYRGERAMAEVARAYLKAKGLALTGSSKLDWNDVATWMGYFAYEQLHARERLSPAVTGDDNHCCPLRPPV